MRARMRTELDRSDATRFDLKQGEGGLVDLEFLLQYLVLRRASAHPALTRPRATPALLEALARHAVLDAETADALRGAHAVLLDAGLRCTLDRRPRLVAETPGISAARTAIRSAFHARDLDASKAELS